jgi:hypothetical protein
MALKPPANVPPGRLFRSLLQLPRPVERIAYRFDALPTKALRVQALHSVEWADARDSTDFQAAIMASALVGSDGQQIASSSDLLLLTEQEFSSLREAVLPVLWRISPTYTLSDADEWGAVLQRGAEQHGSTVVAMAHCREQIGQHIVEAPEKYFGVPRGALLDGHWMAFRAARAVYVKRTKD